MKHFPRNVISMALAMEEAATGQANQEIELVYYAKLLDLEVLKQAAGWEHQEQWELRIDKEPGNASGGRFRVRETILYRKDGVSPQYTRTEGAPTEYVLTSKTRIEGQAGEQEVAVITSKAQFEQFKAMSPRGMIKERFTFPIEGRDCVWEIDVYKDANGEYAPWVKIDLEISDGNYQRPPFPAGLLDESSVISNSMKSIEVSAKIRELYDTVFITPNPGRDTTAPLAQAA